LPYMTKFQVCLKVVKEVVMTKVVHSNSKPAWNIVGTVVGGQYKWARVPYNVCDHDALDTKFKHEALLLAEFISKQINQKYFP